MIQVNQLTKQFGGAAVVKDLSFEVAAGAVLGFLGPNGAGKSTTMKMLTGFLAPSSGSAKINGFDIQSERQAAQAEIGYLPEGAPCYEEMTVYRFLHFIAEIRGFRGREIAHSIDRVLERVSLSAVLDQRIETLSKGFKRRVGLAQALIHDPRVLILDEPTDGLDPNQKHQVREMIRSLSDEKIVIISTHILEEDSAVCSRAMIINKGEIVMDNTPEALAELAPEHESVSLMIQDLDPQEVASALSLLPESDRVVLDPDGRVTVFPKSIGSPLLGAVQSLVAAHEWRVVSMVQHRGQLDAVFRAATEGGAG